MFPHPAWLKKRIPGNLNTLNKTRNLIQELNLNTVCTHSRCPNLPECYSTGTTTFLLLGNVCTRRCTFCNLSKGVPFAIDDSEPKRIVAAVRQMKLKYIVLTSVTRDDLSDGGALQFHNTVHFLRQEIPDLKIEVLIPDFQGNTEAINLVLSSLPDVVGHNIETVPRLYPQVRPQADYLRSLNVIKYVKDKRALKYIKSGLMVGFGETEDEVVEVLEQLYVVGCTWVTLGQYLAPSSQHYPVYEYVTPDKMEKYELTARQIGFPYIQVGTYVRSSYRSAEMIV